MEKVSPQPKVLIQPLFSSVTYNDFPSFFFYWSVTERGGSEVKFSLLQTSHEVNQDGTFLKRKLPRNQESQDITSVAT